MRATHSRPLSNLFFSFLAALALAQAASRLDAQGTHTVSFKVTGAGVVDYLPLTQPAFHFADGTATHLGKYHAEGIVQIDAFTSPTTADFSSAVPVVFRAANGDQISFNYEGSVELIDAGDGEFITRWVAEFTPVSGTGRFAKVTGGSFIMTAVTEPSTLDQTDIEYSWTGTGQLMFTN